MNINSMTAVCNKKNLKNARQDPPLLSAISATRSPQMPLMATSTLSPGSTVLNTAHSIAAWPEPLIEMVMLFCV